MYTYEDIFKNGLLDGVQNYKIFKKRTPGTTNYLKIKKWHFVIKFNGILEIHIKGIYNDEIFESLFVEALSKNIVFLEKGIYELDGNMSQTCDIFSINANKMFLSGFGQHWKKILEEEKTRIYEIVAEIRDETKESDIIANVIHHLKNKPTSHTNEESLPHIQQKQTNYTDGIPVIPIDELRALNEKNIIKHQNNYSCNTKPSSRGSSLEIVIDEKNPENTAFEDLSMLKNDTVLFKQNNINFKEESEIMIMKKQEKKEMVVEHILITVNNKSSFKENKENLIEKHTGLTKYIQDSAKIRKKYKKRTPKLSKNQKSNTSDKDSNSLSVSKHTLEMVELTMDANMSGEKSKNTFEQGMIDRERVKQSKSKITKHSKKICLNNVTNDKELSPKIIKPTRGRGRPRKNTSSIIIQDSCLNKNHENIDRSNINIDSKITDTSMNRKNSGFSSLLDESELNQQNFEKNVSTYFSEYIGSRFKNNTEADNNNEEEFLETKMLEVKFSNKNNTKKDKGESIQLRSRKLNVKKQNTKKDNRKSKKLSSSFDSKDIKVKNKKRKKKRTKFFNPRDM